MKIVKRTIKKMTRAAMLLLAVMTTMTAWAQSNPYASTIEVDGVTYPRFMEFDAYDGTGTEYTYENNHYRYLVDGDWTTWAVEYANSVEPFIEFDTKKPIILKGYILSTGYNTVQHPNRRPKGWVLKAKRYLSDEWTTIDEQTDYELPVADHEDVIFKKADNENVYQYFRLEISKNLQSEDVLDYGHVIGKAYITELCELQFYGSEYDTTHDLYYASFQNLRRYYPLNAVNLNYTVKNSAGTTLTKGTDYTETIQNSSDEIVTEFTEVGTYTLTVTGTGDYSGTLSSSFVVYEKLAGSGTQGDPYIIGDATQWQVFATSLNEGNQKYIAAYIKLADDFDNSDDPITMMASTSDNPFYCFYGHFDGNGRTLHINLTASDQDYCAPFRQTLNADIHDLNVAGTITMTNGKRHAGSIVGCVNSGSTITNCHSTVTINDIISHDGRHGGMVGLNQNSSTLRFTNCSFQGKILGSGNSCGGFVGWNNDDCAINYNNCFFMPSELGNKVKNNSSTFNCSYSGTSTFTDAYYFKDMNLGLKQGLEISDTHPASRVYKKVIAFDGKTYYSDNVNTTLYTKYRYRLTNGGAIRPLVVVKHGDNVLTEGTDYTIDYSLVNSTKPYEYPIYIVGEGSYAGFSTEPVSIDTSYGMTVYEDTDESECAPFRGKNLTDYQKTEFVIPASQLTAMKGQIIKELRFFMTFDGDTWENTFTVFMKEVDFTEFPSQSPSFVGTEDATQVFSGKPGSSNNTVTFTFNNNNKFEYKGGNLLIGCYVEKSDKESDLSFYGKNVTGACIHGSNADNMDDVSPTRYDFLPTVSFGYDLLDLANDNKDNTSDILCTTGKRNVILSGRTLYKDGAWNTICLPFSLNYEQHEASSLGASDLIIMELNTQKSKLEGSMLTLVFGPVSVGALMAGKPYLVQWISGDNIVNPIFTGVTIQDSAPTAVNFEGGKFIGTYDYRSFDTEDKSILFVGANNKLYWPKPDLTDPSNPVYPSIGAFRSYFQLNDGTEVREIVLNFGDDVATSMQSLTPALSKGEGAWYSLDGRKLQGKPSTKGVYIYNGRKVVIK